jgi:hypothetical protein
MWEIDKEGADKANSEWEQIGSWGRRGNSGRIAASGQHETVDVGQSDEHVELLFSPLGVIFLGATT